MNILHLTRISCRTRYRNFSSQHHTPKFGILFDIDGVIARGRNVLPPAKAAFRKLVDSSGHFKVPVIFVTNAGNALAKYKAEQLSKWLEVSIGENQVVMSHSPFKLFCSFHKKRMLIAGQGPIAEIAHSLGFSNVITVDELRDIFPLLDAVDLKRRESWPKASDVSFSPVEGVILFGEPVRWETALQLVVDAVMSDGNFKKFPPVSTHPHIPLLACNMDLQWVSEAPLPRIGHGAFLLCLEALYHKITGLPLIYSGFVGKPSEITFHFAYTKIIEQAMKIGCLENIKNLYVIGDNIFTDILGANLYNHYLTQRSSGKKQWITLSASRLDSIVDCSSVQSKTVAESCSSIVVKTGVYNGEQNTSSLDHSPRDMMQIPDELRTPKHIAEDVLEAVELIFKLEGFQ